MPTSDIVQPLLNLLYLVRALYLLIPSHLRVVHVSVAIVQRLACNQFAPLAFFAVLVLLRQYISSFFGRILDDRLRKRVFGTL